MDLKTHHFLAFDLGAESGRTMLGILDGQHIQLKELNRFPNKTVDIGGHLHWNVLQLFEEIKKGMRICATEVTPEPEGIGVDTWGVEINLMG